MFVPRSPTIAVTTRTAPSDPNRGLWEFSTHDSTRDTGRHDAGGSSPLSAGSNREETRTGTAHENLIKTGCSLRECMRRELCREWSRERSAGDRRLRSSEAGDRWHLSPTSTLLRAPPTRRSFPDDNFTRCRRTTRTQTAGSIARSRRGAAFLGVPLRTIYRWRSRHEGPRGYRVGRHVRYRFDDVERWLADRSDTP